VKAEPQTHVVDVIMPRLSDSMEEATVLRWLKQPGAPVAKGEPLVEVETDKATIVYEAEFDGVLEAILVAEGGSAALGEVIAQARSEGEAPAPRKRVEAAASPPARATATALPATGRTNQRRRATPVARRLAAELGVPLEGVNGSGPGGRIVRADVRSAARAGGTGLPTGRGDRGAVTDVRLTPTQRTIALRMTESRAQVPEFTLEAEIDMEAAAALRDELRDLGRDPLPSFNDLVVKAAALALRDFPGLNASYEDGRVLRFGRVNVGIAVATDDALVVPTIFDADRLSIFEIARVARLMVERVGRRDVGVEDLRDGTFTVSNLGMYGVRRFNAVINPPQAAILAVGEVARRPAVGVAGEIVARYQMDVALSCDHRVVYGAEAARFLQRLKMLLERPVALVVNG